MAFPRMPLNNRLPNVIGTQGTGQRRRGTGGKGSILLVGSWELHDSEAPGGTLPNLAAFLTVAEAAASQGVQCCGFFCPISDSVNNLYFLKDPFGDCPGGPVVKTLPFHYIRHGLNPWSGNQDPTCHTVVKKIKIKRPHWVQLSTGDSSVCTREPRLMQIMKTVFHYLSRYSGISQFID